MSTSATKYSTNDVKLRKSEENAGMFYLPLSDTAEGTCDFVLYPQAGSPTVMSLNHVIVPKEFGGKGLAQILCAKAFDFAKQNKYKIYPQCPYVRDRYVPTLQLKEDIELVTNTNPALKSGL